LTWLFKEIFSKGFGSENVALVIFSLIHIEGHPTAVEVLHRKGLDGVGKIDALAVTWGANLELLKIECANLLC
jgi:hypothetical protein